MVQLSESYAKTGALLDGGKTADAAKEYSDNFSATIKKMFSNTATTYPIRFKKMDTWCEWMRNLYVVTRQAEDALIAKDVVKARAKLAELRETINTLHVKAQAFKTNDYIYAIEQQVRKDQPDAAELSKLSASLEKAPPSAKAKADPKAYTAAAESWQEGAEPILKDGKVEQDELKDLRSRTDQFYKAYGIQFE